MLSRSPELRTLFLHYSGPQLVAEAQWPAAVITLSKLEILGLVDLEPECLTGITSRLNTPNVKRLEIELLVEEDETAAYDDWLCSISTNGSHKFQSLVSLTITELQCDDFDTSLGMFLGTLNQLRELEMKDEVWSSVWRMFVVDLEWTESTTESGVTQVAAPASSSSSSPPLLLPNLEVVKVRDAMMADRTADVKLIVRSRKRSGAGGRQQSSGPCVVEDRSFAIVGALPVHVKSPKGTTSYSSERNRQTQILRRLVRLIEQEEGQREEGEDQREEEEYMEKEEHGGEEDHSGEEDVHREEDETRWKVCVDVTIEAIREEVYEDDDEPVEYIDEDEEEE
ncbi:hypothetical protein PM082_017179 [Marasmius tenuissimus]|nr:hypothetical protein PM082_017179 [Marasmius tenuissimus]